MDLTNIVLVVIALSVFIILILSRRKTGDRHTKILDYITTKEKITTIQASKLLNVSDDTALRELRKMISRGLIKRKGVGRGIYYVKKWCGANKN